MIAYCYADGAIHFGPTTPDGALPFCKGKQEDLVPFVTVVARHSKTSDALFVPGLPEVFPNGEAALTALGEFVDKIRSMAESKGLTCL